MNETMVERVAKAIYEEDDPWHVAFPWPNLTKTQAGVDAYRRCARAAIEAMREPTEAMERAGLREMTIDPAWAKPAWQAMISAALSEDSK